jgi:hypothetical protein
LTFGFPKTRRVTAPRVFRLAPGVLLFAGCLLLVMFFHQGASANPMSRLLTVFALVDDGRLRADRWGNETIDKAIIDGHVYSDKAPLSSFLVLPFYAAWRACHRKADSSVYECVGAHLGDFVAAAVPFALFAVLVYGRAASRLGAPAALRVAWASAFSTCLFNYGNIYYGHMLAALLFLAAYLLAADHGRCALAGFLGGCSVDTEYPLALANVILAAWLFGRRGRTWRHAAAYVAGAIVPGVAMLAYNVWVTGRPFDFPYSHVSDTWKPMRTAFGIRGPSSEAAWELVFGQYRGLLFYAPTLAVLAPLALRRPPAHEVAERRRWGFIVMFTLSQFIFVCSYFKWDGGWCTGPRHLAPLIAILIYEGVGRLADTWPRRRLAFYATALLGIFVNAMAAATNPIPAESEIHPMFSVFLPALYSGKINDHNLAVECHLPNGSWLFGAWMLLFAAFGVLLTLVGRLALPRRAPRGAPRASAT